MNRGDIRSAKKKQMGGAYVLLLELQRAARLRVGALGSHEMSPGTYLYVGSARRGLAARVARHARLSTTKTGRVHWHIDSLLLHPQSRLIRVRLLIGDEECLVSRAVADCRGVEVPVRGFGSTDCRAGCQAHLYRVPGKDVFLHRFLTKKGKVALHKNERLRAGRLHHRLGAMSVANRTRR
jgi:Uri superfamily endonuclease